MPVKLVAKAGSAAQKEYVLEAGKPYSVGRSKEAAIVVKDQRASRHHCTVEAGPDGQWMVADNKSSNGTFVNRQRVTSHVLKDGDVLQVGQASFEFEVEVDAAAATVVAPPEAPKPVAQPAPAAPKPAPAAPKPAPEPVPAKPAPAPAPKPTPAPTAKPAQPAKSGGEENLDEDLKGLFEFLDRIDSTDKPKAAAKSAAPAAAPAKDAPPKEGGLLEFLRKKKQE